MPDPRRTEPSGLCAVGADLEPGTLLAAYRTGLFPMPFRKTTPGWWSPDPRGILPLDGLHVSRSLRRSCRRLATRSDTCFRTVVERCGDPRRPHGWITPQIVDAYERLFQLGWAHSVEVYDDADRLVGGVYGVAIERFFAGESMFSLVTDASKVALVALVERLNAAGVVLFDVQWPTRHLESLGVIAIPRDDYLARLKAAITPA